MITTRHDINFVLFSEQDFETRVPVSAVLKILMSAPAILRPTHYGLNEAEEPIEDLEDVIDMVVMKGRPKVGRRFGGAVLRAGDGCTYQLQWAKMQDPSLPFFMGSLPLEPSELLQPRITAVYELLTKLIPVVDAVYGEVRNMAMPYADAPIDLWTRLPDIPAVSIYGLPYVKMFGEDNVLEASFLVIRRLSGGRYWLEAARSILEPVAEEVKAAVRSHLGEDAFMQGRKRFYKRSRAPLLHGLQA